MNGMPQLIIVFSEAVTLLQWAKERSKGEEKIINVATISTRFIHIEGTSV